MRANSIFASTAQAVAIALCLVLPVEAQTVGQGAGLKAGQVTGAISGQMTAKTTVKAPTAGDIGRLHLPELPDPQAMPDLAFVSHGVSGGKLTVVITNAGKAPMSGRAAASLLVFSDQPVRHEDMSIPLLAPGQTLTWTFATPVNGSYQIVLDSQRVITESNEDNNISAFTPKANPSPYRKVTNRLVKPDLAALQKAVAATPLPRASDGGAQPTAAAAMPDNRIVLFVEDQLILTSKSRADADAIAARYHGKIIHETHRPASSSGGTTYLIRIDTSLKPAAPAKPLVSDLSGGLKRSPVRNPARIAAMEAGTLFSSTAASNLLAIAKAENARGLRLGVNLIPQAYDFASGHTTEGNGLDGLSLDYMRKGGPFNVDVATAWKMLAMAGKTSSKPIRLGIFDGGFGIGVPNFAENDVDIQLILDAQGPGKHTCSNNFACPWHGIGVAEAAAGLADDHRGAVGPAAPVARVLLYDRGSTFDDMVARLWKLNEANPQIINMSFGGTAIRDEYFFEGAWINEVEDFEADTVEIAGTYGHLIFASSGNDGMDVDDVNSDGDESAWSWPCENQGVVCVGGWLDFKTDPTNADGLWGKWPSPNSNYSSQPRGETVDIYGPWCAMIGDNPDNRGADVQFTPCGTSEASPVAAGVAALIWAGNPGLSADAVWQIMSKHAITSDAPANNPIRRVSAAEAVREAIISAGVNIAPSVHIISNVEGVTFTPGSNMTLGYSAFDIEDANACCQADWIMDDTIPVLKGVHANSQQKSFSLKGQALGGHTMKVVVTDSKGLTGQEVAHFTIVNIPPTLKIVAPAQSPLMTGVAYNYRIVASDDVSPFGIGSDECKKIVFKDQNNGITFKIKTSTGCVFQVTYTTAGHHILQASFTDDYGATGTDTLETDVAQTPPDAIAATFNEPQDGYSYSSEDTIIMSLNIYNPSNSAVTIGWTLTDLTSGKVVSFTPPVGSDASGPTYALRLIDLFPSNATSTGGGHYRITATVKAANGKSAVAQVDIDQSAFIK